MLEHLPDQETARKLLLTSEAESHDLGSEHFRSNLLEVAVELRNQKFIAHRYCQGVVEEMWKGRSPACGRVFLKQQPAVMLVVLQCLMPLFKFLPTEINDLYKWKPVNKGKRGMLDGVGKPGQDSGIVEVSLSRRQHIVSLTHIPFVKRVAQTLAHVCFELASKLACNGRTVA